MTSRPRAAAAWMLVLATGVGCASEGGRSSLSGAATEPLSLARVVYEVSDEAALPLREGFAERARHAAIQPASFEVGSASETVTPAPAAGEQPLYSRLEVHQSGQRAVARLSLYERRPEKAPPPQSRRRSLTAASLRARTPESVALPASVAPPLAIYELELPAGELTLILDELESTGAFGAQERPDGGAWLSLGPEGLIPAKQWTPEPRLDDLAERVLREGQEVPALLPSGVGQARVRAAAR